MRIESTEEIRLQKHSRVERDAGSKDSRLSSVVEEREEREVLSENNETGLKTGDGASVS